MLKRILKSQMALNVLASLLASHIRLVFRTSKLYTDPADPAEKLHATTPFVGAMWHGDVMMMVALNPKNRPLTVRSIVARHGDAEIVDKVLSKFGITSLRGAGAGKRRKDRGGAKVLRNAISALKNGENVALTADVPPGPGRQAGIGIVSMAKMSGCPVLPCAIATSRRITLNSWDRFTINLPFSKLGFVVGNPIPVDKNADEQALEAARQQVEKEMNRVTRRAYEIIGETADDVLAPQDGGKIKMKQGFQLKAYRFLTRIARPIAPLILAWRAKKGKEDPVRQKERLGIPGKERPDGFVAWFHAASVGETNAILPLMTSLAKSHPTVNFLLTTGTVTSAKSARDRLPEGAIHQYVPLDSPKFVKRFLNHWKPDLALFTESEIWPNLILQSAERDIPLMLLNARMSLSSYKTWRKQAGLSRPLFSRFDLILAQNDQLARRFRNLGAHNAVSVGNLKIDSPALPVNADLLEKLRSTVGNRPILTAASTHPGEDELIADAHKQLKHRHPDLLTIIVPRHPERGPAILKMLNDKDLAVSQRSNNELPSTKDDVYLADTIGELGLFYTISTLAFIGGSLFTHGGQNPVEAIKTRTAILTGPSWHNFKDAYTEMFRLDACREASTVDEIVQTVSTLLEDENQRKQMIAQADEAIINLSGALAKTIEAIETYLPAPQTPQGMRRAS